MDYDELERLVLESKDPWELQRAFSSLNPVERKSLSARTVKLNTQLSRSKPNKDASDRLRKYLSNLNKVRSWRGGETFNVTLALFAVGPVSSIKKSDIFVPWDKKEVITQVVLDRKPDWLDDWLAYDLDQEFSVTSFPMVRRWIQEGVCAKPSVDGYFRMLAWNLKSGQSTTDKSPKPPLSKQLLAEPDMLDDIWRLFEIETRAFDDPSWIRNNASQNYESWSDALIKLSAAGKIDRDRLLDASLSGLLTDVKQNCLSGFHKFHKRLEPSAEELTRRQRRYLDLMCHKIGHVAKFSLSMLKLLEKHGNLDQEKFLSEVPVIFQHDAKGIAVDAVRLVRLVIKKQPDHLARALHSLLDALRHPNIDVQSMVLDIFEGYEESLNDGIKDELSSVADFVSVSLRARLQRLTNQEEATLYFDSDDKADISIDTPSEIDDIAPEKREALGLGGLFESEGYRYASIVPNIVQQDILQYQEPIEPIKDLDELIASISHAVESVDSPDDVERILDGISRLCNERPVDFRERVAPLLHRLESGGGLITKNGIASSDGGTRLVLADLIFTWLTGTKYKSPFSSYFTASEALVPANNRLRSILKRVVKKQAQPLIAAPTHVGGWIDPEVWVERIIEFEEQKADYDRIELCFSLLRLAPDNRARALERVRTFSGSVFRVADFALGGSELPGYADRKDYDIWISAARSRDPYRDWSDVFEPLKLNDRWADSVQPAVYQWRAYSAEHSRTYNYGQGDQTESWKTPHLDIDVTAGGYDPTAPAPAPSGVVGRIRSSLSIRKSTDSALMPAAALNRRKKIKYRWSADLNSIWLSDWLSYQWPLRPDAAYITGVRQLISRIDMDGSNWEPGFGFLYGLFQKNRPWSEAGHLLVCVGLVGKDADARGLAIDALVAGTENGCLDVSTLAETLIKLSDSGWLKLNRLGDNLQQVSQVSILHAWVISDLIQRWLLKVDIKQRYIFRMLEVLREAQSTVQQPLKPETMVRLKEFTGSAKAAKIARELAEDLPINNALILQLKKLTLDYRV